MTLFLSTAILAGLLAVLSWERLARDRALAALPIRIHVNGTRGKSSVVRLVAGALREAGVRTVAKTTGTAPRLILPDGSERTVRRRAPASIREQLWALREARRMRAAAVVLECMAVDEDLQTVCEERMIRSTLGVITNARLDHGEAMGPTVDDVARALTSTVPRSGVLVIGATEGEEIVARAARARGSRVVRAEATREQGETADGEPWAAANIAVALAVARELGIPEDVARRGFQNASPDPGAARRARVEVAGRLVDWIDASAANDPQSLGLILGPRRDGALFVFHHRADRPARLIQFAERAPWSLDADALLVTGDRPEWSTWRHLRRRMPDGRAEFAPSAGLAAGIRRRLRGAASPSLIVFCGNTKGLHANAIVAAVQQD